MIFFIAFNIIESTFFKTLKSLRLYGICKCLSRNGGSLMVPYRLNRYPETIPATAGSIPVRKPCIIMLSLNDS